MVTIYALCYGDYHFLHKRLLSSIAMQEGRPLRAVVWCNQVCRSTIDLIERLDTKVDLRWFDFKDDNTPKYKAMREMFDHYPPEDWIIWMDDDSYWTSARAVDDSIRHLEKIGAQYAGEPWLWHWRPGEWEAIQQAAWFNNKTPQIIRNKAGINFAQGGCWWLKDEVRQLLNWPDVRLSHNGGDTKLAEACRQHDIPLTPYKLGYQTNKAPRRGLSEKPLGAK